MANQAQLVLAEEGVYARHIGADEDLGVWYQVLPSDLEHLT
jgi:hypothetical protein